MKRRQNNTVIGKMGQRFDSIIGVVSPKAAFRRAQFRAAYDALSGHRTNSTHNTQGGTGDIHLDEHSLWKLREICRDLATNNPLVKGLLKRERNSVVGSGARVEARAVDASGEPDEKWNDQAEEMFEDWSQNCDITGRFSFKQYQRMMFMSYRRDGDMATGLIDGKLLAAEGEQIGTPLGLKTTDITVINGVAFDKAGGRLLGYYIGKPDKWGYIQTGNFQKYLAQDICHHFNPERFSYSRGEPALASAINTIDKLSSYIDAELVAAKVNACLSAFISRKDPAAEWSGIGELVTNNDGKTERQEKMEPGQILYGEVGESATLLGQTRPGQIFDTFVLRCLSLIGQPLCIPLMLVSLDFSGATFMNARFAYNEARDNWQAEQDFVLKPFVSRIWRWKISQFIKAGDLEARPDAWNHEVFCRKWPYVDPYREAQADTIQLENRTTDRRDICSRQGRDWRDIDEQLKREGPASKDGKGTKKTGESQDDDADQ